jgi:ankyrin repeat protein
VQQIRVNVTDNDGSTVLHYAASDGQREVVKWLIEEKKADVNATDNNGRTALKCAVTEGQWEVVMWLVEKNTDINATNNIVRTMLYDELRVNRARIAGLERETENLRLLYSYWKDRACELGASPLEDGEGGD